MLTPIEFGKTIKSKNFNSSFTPSKIMVYCKPYDKNVIISFMTLYKFMQTKFPKI